MNCFYIRQKNVMTEYKSSRIESVDVLRGFAIVAIMLLHNIEHFDFYFFPEDIPQWMKTVDSSIWKSLFFLFGGKAYAIFALLFGFTFYIQLTNQQNKGNDFAGRFLWRLFLLLGFGIVNSMFYEGDILTIYALIGFVLIPVRKMKTGWVLAIALFLLLQPFEWGRWFYFQSHPELLVSEPVSNLYFAKVGSYLSGDSLLGAIKGNITNGKMAVMHWSWENGRFFQTAALFMMGMLLGRKGWFKNTQEHQKLWRNIFFIAISVFLVLFYSKDSLAAMQPSEASKAKLAMIFTTYSNFAFMGGLVSLVVWLYFKNIGQKILRFFVPFGRMSLTNYVMQSIMGTFVYYGYGLGLYQFTGATFSILVALVLITIQWLFCRWWLKNHSQGPLENLWHKATWV